MIVKMLLIAAVTAFVCTAASAQNLLVNPGFEADGALGYWVGTTGWKMADGSFAMLGTDSTNPHSGSYCWAIGAYGTTGLAYTVPMLSQVFTTTASQFTVSGWTRTNSVGTAMVRIRENKTGGPGTVRVFKNGTWGTTAWGIADTAGQTSWDCYAMSYFGQGLDQQVVMYNVPQWTKFSFVVTALPGVTEYSLDISAANQGAVEGGVAYFDDMSVVAPEPASVAALAMGLISFCGFAIRRKK